MIDSHSRFAPNWDVELINEWKHAARLRGNAKVVLSTRPNAYSLTDTDQTYLKHTDSCVTLPHELKDDVHMRSNGVPWKFPRLEPLPQTAPRRSYWISCGFVFAPGEWYEQVPIDPHIPFNGEEDSLSMRTFTYGWDIYTPSRCHVYHCYVCNLVESKEKYRPLYWQDTESEFVKPEHGFNWTHRLNWTKEIIDHFYYDGPVPQAWANDSELAAKFGLGCERTRVEYANHLHVDFKTRVVDVSAVYE